MSREWKRSWRLCRGIKKGYIERIDWFLYALTLYYDSVVMLTGKRE